MPASRKLLPAAALATALAAASPLATTAANVPRTTFHRVAIGEVEVFYREAGDPARPTILLLHGFPTSSFMYRDLIPRLADRYHVVAPDLPGFGYTRAPDREHFAYTFAHLAEVMDGFTRKLGLERYALQVFDYGAPVGLRLALAQPERVSAIVSQNGNAYEEGLAGAWTPIQAYWKQPSAENREAVRAFLQPDSLRWQYEYGAPDATQVAPETYTLDSALMARPGNEEIQLDLFLDYASNVALYPEFQEYFRTRRPPLLAVWGNRDPFFAPAGAEAYRRDLPEAEIHFYDTGHFALETHGEQIGRAIVDFLDRHLD